MNQVLNRKKPLFPRSENNKEWYRGNLPKGKAENNRVSLL